ncbi:hypothetical protein [Vreelandella janggokensis]|uniref:Helix-turn-helix domain-containing protein n=2 Tax=Vreelandella janggokensis TaxID=370767 RepID=A0ABT4IS26_9GAMM|nr:hypothetical protein [Halomonas janggokensis]MCZ0926469.1 helix-turn-helix domain-containing protein [Halomonas janggokensis]
MTEKEWSAARKLWESDKREGYAWLIREMSLDISGPGLRKRALKEGWEKGGKPKTGNQKPKTARKPKTRNQKPKPPPTEELEELPEELKDKAVPLEDADSIEWGDDDEGEGEATHTLTLSRVRTQSLEENDESPLTGIFESGGSTKYHPAFPDLAYKHCLLGATPADVATLLRVSEQTIYNWMSAHPEFGIAMEEGRGVADANVASSLYKRATGFTHRATKVFQYKGVPVVVPYTEVVHPDTSAATFWLTNRQPEQWKNKVEVEEKPTIALVDREARRERIEKALEHAAQVEREMRERRDRLGLVIDGDTGTIDDG